MEKSFRFGLVLVLVFSLCSTVFGATEPERWFGMVPTSKLKDIRSSLTGSNSSFTTFGTLTATVGGEKLLTWIKKHPASGEPVQLQPGEKLWLMTTKDPALQTVTFPGVRQLWKGFGFRILAADDTAQMGLAEKVSSDFTRIEPLPANVSILSAPRRPLKSPPQDPLQGLLERVDKEAFATDLKALVDLKTRYTYSDGAKKAIDYCETVMKELGLTTRRLPFKGASTPAENLEGLLPGFDPSNAGEVIIIGHLDSTSPQASTLAPGADDNGTGAAGVLALARFMKGLKGRASVRFLVVLGEEQGMLGSKAYVAGLKPEELARIRGVINMDMIGFEATPPLSMMFETARFCEPLVQQMQDLAAKYTTLTTTVSWNPWGSDHIPFIKKEIQTVLTIESEFDDNPTYHKVTDTFEKVNQELSYQILRLNAATLAELAAVER